jgi:hypothetical protein
MSIANPLQQVGVDLVVALVVNAGTGGDKAKKATRAQAILNIAGALQELAAGNVAAGLTALQGAIATPDLDPGVGLAVQSFISFASTQLTALQALLGGSVQGQIDAALAANLLADVTKACQAYIPAA